MRTTRIETVCEGSVEFDRSLSLVEVQEECGTICRFLTSTVRGSMLPERGILLRAVFGMLRFLDAAGS
ncbi:hypothetical protein [Paenibacillus massiliensis]|uniref:hypothetical protein n=1 Tax=Paenibacillus massiliensis TaxID=225917 RepID=UPI0012B5EF8E|nr:hypothetical protein [Paenibacillus massiliensis]